MLRYATHIGRGCAAGRRAHSALCAAMAAVLVGCHTAPPRASTVPRAPDAERAPDATPGAAAEHGSDGTYDWHGLLIAPFGTVLKSIPLTLHEVLLFRDEAHGSGTEDAAAGVPAPGAASADAARTDAAGTGASECYAADTPAPPFAGRTPDEYLLCFARDRLARIQASVRLTADEAPGVFSAACTAWLKDAAPAAETQTLETGAAACEGDDGAIRFSGRLEEATDRSEMPPTESMMSITLERASDP